MLQSAGEDLVIWQETGPETLRAGIRADMQVELKALDDKWSQRLAALDDKWSQRIAALDDKLIHRLHQVDRHVGEAKADLMRWSFVFWVGAVAAVAALTGSPGLILPQREAFDRIGTRNGPSRLRVTLFHE